MLVTAVSSSSTLSDRSTGLPSTISRRHPFLADLGEHELEVLAVDLEDRRAQLDRGPFRQRQDGLENLARRPARHRLAGARTVRLPDRGVEQVEIARDVGHRPDGRARVVREGLLLDRDDRRQAEHEVHVGLRHLRDEALGVAGERLHVAPLPFGIDGVEGEARLAGSRQAGDHDQAVARNLDRDVLEVVHARALDRDRGPRGGSRTHDPWCRRPAPGCPRYSFS